MKRISVLLLFLVAASSVVSAENDKSCIAINKIYNRTIWGNSVLPPDAGLRQSDTFGGITFTGRYASYTNADTWYLTYASDGTMYSSYTDGAVNGEKAWSPRPRCARVTGYDPLGLSVEAIGELIDHNGGGGKLSFGRYPCAQLMYNDIWYYGTYLLEQNDRSIAVPNSDWSILQPFIGFRVSEDFGQGWYDMTDPDSPIFENPHDKWVNDHNVSFNPYEVMIGAPHFVDFGENMKYAPVDGPTGRKWAYMVAHGADAGTDIAHNSWVSGDNIYLLRILMPEGRDVKANSDYVNDPSNWQYLSKDGKYRNWTRDDLQEVYDNIRPIVDATGYLGNVGLTYDAPLGKFIMALSRADDATHFDTLILESDTIDGEYKVIQYMKGFADVSYFMMIPSRFISDDGKTMWLGYSSNYFPNIHYPSIGGSCYAMCLSEITLDDRSEAAGRKYEAEGMRKLVNPDLVKDDNASNGSVIKGISRLGEGLEFVSKSNGNALGLAFSRDGLFSKRISVYVNDRFSSKFVINAAGEESCYTLQYIPVEISYGDKVTLKIDHDDVGYNRIYGEYSPEGVMTAGPGHHIIGALDYAVVDNVDFRKPDYSRKKGAGMYSLEVNAPQEGEYSLVIRYSSAFVPGACDLNHVTLEVNKKKADTLDLSWTNGDADYSSVLITVSLEKGKNIIRLSGLEYGDNRSVEIESIGMLVSTNPA